MAIVFRALLGAALLSGCGSSAPLRITDGSNWEAYVRDQSGGPPSGDVQTLRFREGLCEGEPMKPEHGRLDERHLVQFLERQKLDVRLDRARADLVFVSVTGAGTAAPVRMRVAVLENADAAGRELHEALLQHGTGAWGVHRSNLAILGPAGDPADDLTFSAKTKLACWGVFTIAGRDDTFVVPGGYTEL
jgi:hypothetical protein